MNDLERVYDDYLALTENSKWDSSHACVFTGNHGIKKDDAPTLQLVLLESRSSAPIDTCDDARVCALRSRSEGTHLGDPDFGSPVDVFSEFDRTLAHPVLPRYPEILLRLKALPDE